MESKNIIIILVAIIAVLGLVLGVMFFQTANAKEPTKVKITSNNTLYEGKDLTLKLTDLNKTPIAKEKVNITIKNGKGKVVAKKTVKTNDKGNAKLDLNLKKGKYSVNVTYGGNKNYTGSNTTQKLTVKEEVKQAVIEESSSSSSDSGGYDRYSPQYGTYIKQYTDSDGIQHIDGANGMHESYDPKTGKLSGVDANGHEY